MFSNSSPRDIQILRDNVFAATYARLFVAKRCTAQTSEARIDEIYEQAVEAATIACKAMRRSHSRESRRLSNR
jgi:hypothetical protein